MHPSSSCTASCAPAPAPSDPNTGRRDQSLIERLKQSPLFREYRKAFEETTGLPLAVRSVGSFDPPLRGSRNLNPFCALMSGVNQSCGACLELQQRLETTATAEPSTARCYAGLSETAVPIRIGDRIVGFLQTGQIFLSRPTETQFQRTLRQAGDQGAADRVARLKAAYFGSRVLDSRHYQSIVRLLSIFARHLGEVSNQLMVSESSSVSPGVSRALAYVAAHIGEELRLEDVARAAGMSSYYLCKLFHKETGATFTEYVGRTRVETVKRLLLNPHTRVSEAAYEAGFQSLSQFNRVFRRITGEAPTAYRDRIHSAPGRALAIAA